MNAKPYCGLSSVLFLIFAIGHLVRAVRGFPLVIGGLEVPIVASWLVVAVAGLLGVWGARLALRP
jgi:hypothetical protein